MKLLGNYKFWILFIFGISFYIIVALELNYFPRFPSVFPDKAENFNKLFLAVGYSLFTAVVFYYFSVVLPRIIQIKRNKKIVAKQVHFLLYELFVVLNQILFAFDINKDLNDVEEKDLIIINGKTTNLISGYYKTSFLHNSCSKKGRKIYGFSDIPFSFPESIINQLSNIPEKIELIRKSNPNFYIDENFSEILSSIETNKIIKWYGIKKEKLFRYGNSSYYLFSLIQDYKRLKKLKYQKTHLNSNSEIYFYNDKEVLNTRRKRGLTK